MPKCNTCGADWSADQWTEDCNECGGGAMTHSCIFCGGECGGTSKRAGMDSNDTGVAHWYGNCPNMSKLRQEMRDKAAGSPPSE